MIQVYIELASIIWENDQDSDIAYEHGTNCSFVADIPDSWALTEEDIDKAIADSLEDATGHRPKSWALYVFDDQVETA